MKFLTKGDNNSVDDRGLYAPGQLWLKKDDIVGRARGVLPFVGMITIYMNEYPNFKVMIHLKFDFVIALKMLISDVSKFFVFLLSLFIVRYIGSISDLRTSS